MINRLLQTVKAQQTDNKKISHYRALKRKEAAIGGELFGPIPAGHRREFFCMDETTWIWHEEWLDANGKLQVLTTRYDVRPTGILKAQDGKGYQAVSKAEGQNLIRAARLYRQRVLQEVYNISVSSEQ